MMQLRSALAATAAALLCAGAAHAATYNATSSFNGTATGGAFTYGTDTGGLGGIGGTFTPFTSTSADCAGNANFICANDSDLVPGIGKVLDGGQASFSTVVVPSGTLWVHPGMNVDSAIIFTAPVSGSYTFSATTGRLDTTNGGNGVAAGFEESGVILPNNTPYGAQNGGTTLETQTLSAGQQFGYFVYNEGDYTYDSTAVDLSVTGPDAISGAPEPGAWALMFAGVAMMGAMLRRRRQGSALAA